MSENEDIHCNVLQCRRALCHETEACVTSCSHIFCINCANHHFNQALVCPACSTPLTQSDDIVVTQLNPSEEYKSSILAGLKPDVIMDISSRAVAFHSYQISQELSYKSIMYQNMESKCTSLQEQLRDTIRDSNRTIKAEKQKNTTLIRDQEQEKRRGHDLQTQLHEKTRQFQKLQLMYEKLKRKSVTPNIQQTLNQQPQVSHIMQQQQQQPQERTPESMSTTSTAALFSASRARRPYPYAPSTLRADSPTENITSYSNNNNSHTGGITTMQQQSTPASPAATHIRRHHLVRPSQHMNMTDTNPEASSGYLLTTPYSDLQKQQQQYPPSSISGQRNSVRNPVSMDNTSSKHHQQLPHISSYNTMVPAPPPPTAVGMRNNTSTTHHQLLDITNHNPMNQHHPSGDGTSTYATVVSPQTRSVVGNMSRTRGLPMTTPSPRLRPFTSGHRLTAPHPSHHHHRHYP
ncbi:hypothetical protein BDA99DRAFT_564723 [Phascolomyces articulosus]|uniref:RING-type domain-containing protein n=1 Tax=Phascolomyces articulosus TaxID=60185 RepID=A0AAD5P8U7_9FUNG|nr:hypothetical protein BDA99DRAFT_564723 [Phascolomyces articulosus]